MKYKVVELSIVTDETLQKELNRWTSQGWHFDSVQFVVRDNSRRPSMAFLIFIQEELAEDGLPGEGGNGRSELGL